MAARLILAFMDERRWLNSAARVGHPFDLRVQRRTHRHSCKYTQKNGRTGRPFFRTKQSQDQCFIASLALLPAAFAAPPASFAASAALPAASEALSAARFIWSIALAAVPAAAGAAAVEAGAG